MQKKILIFFISLILIFHSTSSFGEISKYNAEISKIETNLYGFDYKKESLEKRVERLEKTVYGKSKNGDINSRIAKITSDIFSAQMGQEITPSTDTFKDLEEIADDSVNYPIVDEIENKLFNQVYKNRDFHTRIVTIERKLFNKIYDVEDYASRMERIKKEVYNDRTADAENLRDYSIVNLDSQEFSNKKYNSQFNNAYGQQNYQRPYTNYGSDFLANNNYTPDELSQIESEIFGTEFSNDSPQKRLKRIKSATKAQQSSAKYDSNKFQQRMSMAMEIGAMILMILAMVL